MLRDFYNSEELSDITLIVAGEKIPAHSQLLQMASPYLRTKLKPCWNQDTKLLQINLPSEIPPSLFKLFLRMIYGDINPSPQSAEIDNLDVLSLIKLAQLSSQYLVTQLT